VSAHAVRGARRRAVVLGDRTDRHRGSELLERRPGRPLQPRPVELGRHRHNQRDGEDTAQHRRVGGLDVASQVVQGARERRHDPRAVRPDCRQCQMGHVTSPWAIRRADANTNARRRGGRAGVVTRRRPACASRSPAEGKYRDRRSVHGRHSAGRTPGSAPSVTGATPDPSAFATCSRRWPEMPICDPSGDHVGPHPSFPRPARGSHPERSRSGRPCGGPPGR
jgi:hypothetical protein